MATGDAPVLEALIDINAVSLARADLDPTTLLLVRIAALAAVDAPAASYLMHLGPMMESGVKVEQVQDVLVAVAPITGAPRVLSAATKITEALGFTIAVAEMAAEADAKASMSDPIAGSEPVLSSTCQRLIGLRLKFDDVERRCHGVIFDVDGVLRWGSLRRLVGRLRALRTTSLRDRRSMLGHAPACPRRLGGSGRRGGRLPDGLFEGAGSADHELAGA